MYAAVRIMALPLGNGALHGRYTGHAFGRRRLEMARIRHLAIILMAESGRPNRV